MKDKILEIINIWLIPKPNALISDDTHAVNQVVTEIESYVGKNYVEKEFMVWASQFAEVIPYTIEYYLIGSGLPEMQFDELYQYWLKKIKYEEDSKRGT